MGCDEDARYPVHHPQLARLERIQHLILRQQVLEDGLEEGRVEASEAPVHGILPVLLDEVRPGVWVQSPPDEDVAGPPAHGRGRQEQIGSPGRSWRRRCGR